MSDRPGQWLQHLDDVFAGFVATAPPSAVTPPDMDQIRRLMDQIQATRPEWDRVAMHPTTIAGLPKAEPRPPWMGADLFGVRVIEDPSLPPGGWELRDGDRVIRRYVDAVIGDLATRHANQIRETAERANALGFEIDLDHPQVEHIHGDDGITVKVSQAGRLVRRVDADHLPCCDMHGRNCEQGGEECCAHCTEAHHFAPGHGGVPCSSPDLSGFARTDP